MWKHLKGKQVHGADFHRQRPVDQFIVDFYCSELYLGIELDGYTHQLHEVAIKDAVKEKRLTQLGVKLIRFDDEEIYYDLDNVLRVIEAVVLKRKEKFGI